MADRAQHPVLLVQHREDTAAHRVEGSGQVAHVTRPPLLHRVGRPCPRKLLRRPRQLPQRPRQPSPDPQQRQEHDHIKDQRLPGEPAAKARRPVARTRLGHDPLSRCIFSRHRQPPVPWRAAHITHRAHPDTFPAAHRWRLILLCHPYRQHGQSYINEHRHGAPLNLRSPFARQNRGCIKEARTRRPVARRRLPPTVQRIDDAINPRRRLRRQRQPIALPQQQPEIDRLRHEQRNRHQRDDLPDQALRPKAKAPHSFLTSADSV